MRVVYAFQSQYGLILIGRKICLFPPIHPIISSFKYLKLSMYNNVFYLYGKTTVDNKFFRQKNQLITPPKPTKIKDAANKSNKS